MVTCDEVPYLPSPAELVFIVTICGLFAGKPIHNYRLGCILCSSFQAPANRRKSIILITSWLIIQCRHCHALADNVRLNLDLIENCPYCGGLLLEASSI
jgi:hypothetical protein